VCMCGAAEAQSCVYVWCSRGPKLCMFGAAGPKLCVCVVQQAQSCVYVCCSRPKAVCMCVAAGPRLYVCVLQQAQSCVCVCCRRAKAVYACAAAGPNLYMHVLPGPKSCGLGSVLVWINTMASLSQVINFVSALMLPFFTCLQAVHECCPLRLITLKSITI